MAGDISAADTGCVSIINPSNGSPYHMGNNYLVKHAGLDLNMEQTNDTTEYTIIKYFHSMLHSSYLTLLEQVKPR